MDIKIKEPIFQNEDVKIYDIDNIYYIETKEGSKDFFSKITPNYRTIDVYNILRYIPMSILIGLNTQIVILQDKILSNREK